MSVDRDLRPPLVAAVAALALALLVGTAASVPAQEPDGGHHGHAGHDRVHEFTDAEGWAARFDDPSRDAWQQPDAVVEMLALGGGMTVADIGAGSGYFTPYLSRAVGPQGRVLALDVSEQMVAYLREKRLPALELANAEARRVEPDDPGLGPGTVDRILIVDTWHHIRDRAAYAATLARSLAPGGRVVIVDFTKDADQGPPVAMRLAPEEVVAELEAGGLVARVVEEGLPKQYVVVGTPTG